MHVLKYFSRKFDYAVGARIEGFEDMVQLSDAPIIIIEGDEYLSSPIDRTPKFLKYHHHIGLNTWASARGPKAEQGMLGLIGYELIFPGDQTLRALIDFLALRDIAFDQNDGRIRIEDPAGNQIFICR